MTTWPKTFALSAVLAGLMGQALPAGAADALAPWSAAQGGEPPAPWRVSGLPHQSKPYTRFWVETWAGTNHVLRVDADKSYGNLVHPLQPTKALHHLSWRWELDEPNREADLRERNAEDTPVRVCVMFDMPLDKVSMVDRALLTLTRSTSGEPVPAATVCYVWDQHLPPGTALHSPFTGRLRMLVLRGHETPLHHWASETRDIEADFKRLFGDEADAMPPVIGVAIGGDSDNTQAHSVAHVGTVSLAP